MNQKPHWIYSGITIVALVSLTVSVMVMAGAAAGKQAGQVATPVPADSEVEQIRRALESDNLSEPGRRSLEEKLAMAERMAAEQAAGAQLPRREKVAPPVPASAIENQAAPIQEGIFEGSQGLVRPPTADIRNVWQGERNGILVQVFAGSLPGEPARGILLVIQANPENMGRQTEWIQAPGGAGALRIVEARESLLILAGQDGSLLAFNLDTLSFQD